MYTKDQIILDPNEIPTNDHAINDNHIETFPGITANLITHKFNGEKWIPIGGGVTLYKRTTTGKIQMWIIRLEENKFRTATGQEGGKIAWSEYTTCEGKNIGRSNETTPSEQAYKEVKSKIKRKLESEYKWTKEEVDNIVFTPPMLAHKFDLKRIETEQIHVSAKLDGIRCLINKDGMWTRNGKPIVSCPHIWDSVKGIFENAPTITLDGELYNHELKDNFNEIVSHVRKSKNIDFDKTKVIEFWMYDVFTPEEQLQHQRIASVNIIGNVYEHVVVCPYDYIEIEEIGEAYDNYIQRGFEGMMLRNPEGLYENKRSWNLMKYKSFQDAEYEIIGVIEGKGNRSGMAGSIRYRDSEGKEFQSNIKGGVEHYKNIWNEKDDYIGGQGTVEFFELTPDGIPRFPVTKALYKGKRDV